MSKVLHRKYVGVRVENNDVGYFVFASPTTPTFASHSSRYNYCIGPFVTMRGARYMAAFGRSNPVCQCVEQAEAHAMVLDDAQRVAMRQVVVEN